MPPKKNTKKMDLGSFLADESFGAWADEEVDFSSISVPSSSTAAPIGNYHQDSSGFDQSARRERVDYPVPDAPPYKARVGNLPYDATEATLVRFFEDRMQAQDIVEEVKLPMDVMTGKAKGFAFVTFTTKAALEEALRLTWSEFNGRKVYVTVAAPQKQDVFDMDWRSGRSGPLGREPRERREEPDLDWGAARSSAGPLSFRERERSERRPRREDPDLDWGAARGSSGPLPGKERKPRREEPELDWGTARASNPLPARERDDFSRSGSNRKSDMDWNSARGSGLRKKEEKEFDWKRGQTLPPREKSQNKPVAKKEENVARPQKPSYDVLSLEDDEESEGKGNEESEGEEQPKGDEDSSAKTDGASGLEKQVADLSV